jgi:hypothetical protein
MHPPSPHWWSRPAPDVFRIRSHNRQDIHYISMPNGVPRSPTLYAQPYRRSRLDLDRYMTWLDATFLSLRRVTAIADHFLDKVVELGKSHHKKQILLLSWIRSLKRHLV